MHLAALVMALGALAPSAFWVKSVPGVANAPCTLRVTVHAAQEEAAYVVAVNGGEFDTGSVKEQPPRTWQFPDFKDLPPDTYDIWVRIFDWRGQVVYAEHRPLICQGMSEVNATKR